MWPTLFKLPWIHLPIRGYGMMLMIGFLGGTWWAARRAARVKGDPDFIINLGFVALIASIIGARLFYVIHYWEDHFAGKGIWPIINVSAGGLEFYGGFIGAVLAGIGYMWLSGKSIRLYLDIVAPSILFGMGMARIGCFLNGCCWGGMCSPDLAWSVRFPYASPAFYRQWYEREVFVPAELIYIDSAGVPYPIPRDLLEMTPEERDAARLAVERARKEKEAAAARGAPREELATLTERLKSAEERYADVQSEVLPLEQTRMRFEKTPTEIASLADRYRTRHVHPVQLYASIDGLLLAVVLNAYFYRRKRHGMVFVALLLIYPVLRIIEEIIRVDNPHDAAGLTISQFVSVVMILLGLAMLYKIRRLPLRSPKAVPHVYPEPKPKRRGKD